MQTVTNVSSNIYNWFKKEKGVDNIKQLSENQILNIANDINGLFAETNLIESKPELSLPRLVVVGTQSSGKSSVLNSIISMDILPTGKNMVTRSPLDLRLYKLDKTFTDGWVEVGVYDSSGFKMEAKIPIDVPIPTTTQINKIRAFITNKTIEIAGNGMDITDKPIILKIYSPYVPNLSLVDLPGLTMVAQVDKGQPINIKEKIEDLKEKVQKKFKVNNIQKLKHLLHLMLLLL
jgi:dynamin 1-like protein